MGENLTADCSALKEEMSSLEDSLLDIPVADSVSMSGFDALLSERSSSLHSHEMYSGEAAEEQMRDSKRAQ